MAKIVMLLGVCFVFTDEVCRFMIGFNEVSSTTCTIVYYFILYMCSVSTRFLQRILSGADEYSLLLFPNVTFILLWSFSSNTHNLLRDTSRHTRQTKYNSNYKSIQTSFVSLQPRHSQCTRNRGLCLCRHSLRPRSRCLGARLPENGCINYLVLQWRKPLQFGFRKQRFYECLMQFESDCARFV